MCANCCRFRFYGNLNDFLPVEQRGQWIDYELDGTVAVKHPIESLGVPHPEVESIIVNGVFVGFGHHLARGEQIRVLPLSAAPQLPERLRLRPPLNRPPHFVVDTHLGRLAAYLRMLGFDTIYRNDFDDADLARIAHDQERVLLTRDRGLLKRKKVIYGFCVRHTDPRAQLVEVLRRYELESDAQPWRRCTHCNGLLVPVRKDDILDELEPKTKLYYREFERCDSCGQIYWKGSHHERMRAFLEEVFSEARVSEPASPYTATDVSDSQMDT
ncbi:MAG: Mut7-C RNAse domain-containing protein [Caldilineaceae bacterium]